VSKPKRTSCHLILVALVPYSCEMLPVQAPPGRFGPMCPADSRQNAPSERQAGVHRSYRTPNRGWQRRSRSSAVLLSSIGVDDGIRGDAYSHWS
jgi:hypothetical protein